MRRLLLAAGALALVAPYATSSARAASTVAPADVHVRRASVSAVVANALGTGGELRGMALDDVGQGRATLDTSIADLPRMAAEGINSVTAYVYLYVRTPTSSAVTKGVYTPTDAELELVGAAAKANGLRFDIMPVLLNNQTNYFRGSFHPDNIPAFFASYTAQVVHYAEIGQKVGAAMLYVGSEQNSLDNQTALWRSLIAAVRPHFSGALTYMATAYTALEVRFWDALDLAAISPYFSLGTDADPSYQRMLDAWSQTHLPYLARLTKALHKPLIFGELGYHSQAGAFVAPSATGSPTALATPQAQANAYRAALWAIAQSPGVYGVTWFRWGTATTPIDTSYSPEGKPAECALASAWSHSAQVRALAVLPVCDLSALDRLDVSLSAQMMRPVTSPR